MSALAAKPGVTGGALPASIMEGLTDRADARGTLHLLAQSLDKGWINPWDVKGEVFRELPDIVWGMVKAAVAEGDHRTVTRGATVLKALGDHNLRLAELLDKSGRLDAGLATENVQQHHTVTFDNCG